MLAAGGGLAEAGQLLRHTSPQATAVYAKSDIAALRSIARARFVLGDEVFGQLVVPPLGSAGTYAERVAVSQDANLARVPHGMDLVTAAALPTAGGTALDIADRLGPLGGKTVLINGAAGGIGSFLT